jgi:hypothetical protein
MRNLDLRHNCEHELELWINNDEYLHLEYKRALRREDFTIIKSAIDECGFQYTRSQLNYLFEVFEDELNNGELSDEFLIKSVDHS